MDDQTVVEVKDLVVHFQVLQGRVPAVNGVSIKIKRGKTLGVVGESGCGKSVTGLAIMRLLPTPPAEMVRGEINFHRQSTGQVIDIMQLHPQSAEMRSIRGNDIAMIFQEPMTSLTPAYTIGEQIMEAIVLHQKVGKREARQRAIQMLDRVGMPQPSRNVDAYPHQLSGGMLQRAMIAAALSCQPSLLIADEPTTALDVTTAAQILDLMGHLQEEMGMATMHVSHNLGVIAEVADDVAVMYLGRIVEQASVDDLFYNPKHPYTQGLMHSIPNIGQRQRLEPIRGVVPEPDAIPKGCAFAPRCPHYSPDTCPPIPPPSVTVGPGHEVCCYLLVLTDSVVKPPDNRAHRW
ncbi:MAG: ABC transporter ATP-binding protein [Chloroflexi bacterium]|nr:ABC transporter ATP-binding protein [Chloroflexota bacterium]